MGQKHAMHAMVYHRVIDEGVIDGELTDGECIGMVWFSQKAMFRTYTLTKVSAQRAAEICHYFELSEQAKPLLREDMTPADLLKLLIKGGHDLNAVQFLAHGLPEREAVWWACLCLRGVENGDQGMTSAALLAAAERWVRQPTDENRRAALGAAEENHFEIPAAWAAAAAGWSGQALALPGPPEVTTAEHVAAHAVAAAIIMTATGAKKAPKVFRAFLDKGIDVAEGKVPMPPVAPGA